MSQRVHLVQRVIHLLLTVPFLGIASSVAHGGGRPYDRVEVKPHFHLRLMFAVSRFQYGSVQMLFRAS